MATLVSGQQYGLSSQANSSSQKSLIFVKLTDTALKAIEEYARNKVNSNQRPSIQFQSSDGTMLIPRQHNEKPARFGFTISNIPENDGSFDCLQQVGPRSINSLGSMLHKMQVHATEDSYEKTRHRVAEVEQKCKNYGTKVIKASGPYVGRKVKVKQPLSTIAPPRPVISSPPSYHNNVLGNLSSTQHSYNPVQKSLPSNKMKSNRPPTSDIMRRNYRERVIHLLAVRPYKKPEILARLMKDGVKEKDKKSLSSVLAQVAMLKDNTYDLARHMWNEVNEDWPFYTESDRQLLKRRKPQNLTPPGENLNPESNQVSTSPMSAKRPPVESEGNPAKKQRISHYQKANEVITTKPSPEPPRKKDNVLQSSSYQLNYDKYGGYMKSNSSSNSVPALFKGDYDSNSLPYDSSSNSPFSSNRTNTYNEDSKRSLPRSGTGLSAFKNLHSNSTKVNSTGSSPSSSPDSIDSNDSGFTGFQKYSDVHDFANKYHKIKNTSQRAEYKSDFNNEYEEYKNLYKKITEVSKIFSTLGNNLKSVPEGSQEYLKIKSQIVQEYQDGKYRKQYQEAKRRFQYLHDKLAYIKRLIADYDRCSASL